MFAGSDRAGSSDEHLGVGVLRIVEHLVGQAMLDDRAALHHHQPMRQQTARRRDRGSPARPTDASPSTRPRSRSRMRACTETSRPPVGSSMNTSRGLLDQVAGDLQALAHAAGKGGRPVVEPVGIDLDPRHPIGRLAADLAIVARAHRHQPLADIGAGAHAHAQSSRASWFTKPHSVRASRRRRASERRCTSTVPADCRLVGDRAFVGREAARQAVEQGRLARRPISPTMPSTSPGHRSKLTSRQAMRPPKRLVT